VVGSYLYDLTKELCRQLGHLPQPGESKFELCRLQLEGGLPKLDPASLVRLSECYLPEDRYFHEHWHPATQRLEMRYRYTRREHATGLAQTEYCSPAKH
jgi:hypothetical protein